MTHGSAQAIETNTAVRVWQGEGEPMMDVRRYSLTRPPGLDPVPDVVWLEDPTQYEYVRQTRRGTTRRRGRIGVGSGAKLIGYEEFPKQGTGIQSYLRRYWWLQSYDRPLDPAGTYGRSGRFPAEAVVVTSVDPLEIRMPRSGRIVTNE